MVVQSFTRRRRIARPLTVALVNNMPDGAFVATEEQFRSLVSAGGPFVDLELYTIDEIPRSCLISETIAARYRTLDDLWDRPPDVLIVTGTEPKRDDLRDEPYWSRLVDLLEWASSCVPAVLLSCLASHASALLFDGIERRRRPVKCSGVFPGRIVTRGHPLAIGLPDELPVPHSRVNEIPEPALTESGYRIVVADGGAAGWSVATRAQGRSLFVLCQGHPEYDTLSLLREYRRDVRRYLNAPGAYTYPCLPHGYLDVPATAMLERFAALATAGTHDPQELCAALPYREVAETVQNTWRDGSLTMYANLLGLARTASAAVA